MGFPFFFHVARLIGRLEWPSLSPWLSASYRDASSEKRSANSFFRTQLVRTPKREVSFSLCIVPVVRGRLRVVHR